MLSKRPFNRIYWSKNIKIYFDLESSEGFEVGVPNTIRHSLVGQNQGKSIGHSLSLSQLYF